MQRKIIINFMYQVSYQILIIFLPVVTIPIVSDALGPKGLGTYNYITSIAAYFILVGRLGMANYGVREISIVQRDRKKLSEKFWELQFFNSFFSLGSLLVFVVFAFFTDYTVLFLVSGLTVFSCFFDITWFFSGIENFKKITIRNFIVKIISFILILFLINDSDDLLLYFLITSLSMLISQMSLWISLKKYIDWRPVSIKACLSHLKPSLEFFTGKMADTVLKNSTTTILGLMATMGVVGYYSNSVTLMTVSGNIVNVMNTVMIPRMSALFSEDDERGMINLLEKSLHLQLFFTIAIMFGVIAISNQMIDWFFGSEFANMKYILPWMAPVIVFQSFQMAVATQYLIPKKEMKEYNISVFIGAVITSVLTVSLIPLIGVYGAVIGINGGYIVMSALRFKGLLKETTFKFDYIKISKYIIAGLSMWLVIYFTTNGLTANVITTLSQILIGVTVYFGVTAILNVNPIYDVIKKKIVKN